VPLQLLRQPDVIPVQKADVSTSGMGNAKISTFRDPGMGSPKHPQPIVRYAS
jgi:hypothetical protein